MPIKRLTKQEFVERARKVHGEKYDYSLVYYKNTKTKVTIICPLHGPFNMAPEKHMARGQGCPVCGDEANKSKIFGIGINDLRLGTSDRCYTTWYNMLQRTVCDKIKNAHPTYRTCTICDDWIRLSKFKEWFDEHYIEGYHIDKDILSGRGQKRYSPETCCFVPREINALFISAGAVRGPLPIGVILRRGKYVARLSTPEKRITVGYFSTKEAAFAAYKAAKEDYIKSLANKYYMAGKLEKRVYDALMNYEVQITD